MKRHILILRGHQMKSNEAVLTIRQNLIRLFKQYEVIFIPMLRFICSLSALNLLKDMTSYTGILSGPIVMMGLALIGAFASANTIVMTTMILTTIFVSGFNLILAVILFIAMCMIYFLYAKLFPRESLFIIVTLIAFSIKLELLIPIIGALFGTYMSIVGMIIGVILWFALPNLQEILPSIAFNKEEILDTLNQLASVNYKSLFVNPKMMVIVVIFFIVFSGVYIIRKQSIDYAAYIAIAVGAVMSILGFGLAIIFFDGIEINLFLVIVQSFGFGLIALVVQFFALALDYQRAETVDFEDDDNYYVVKIVPKIPLAPKHNVVKKIYTDSSEKNGFENITMQNHGINQDS